MDTLEQLFPHLVNWEKTRKGKFTLKNIKKESRYFDYPQFKLKTIHIAGSKGKGTIINILSNLLQSLGENVGTFTSPHIFNVEERIQYNGKPISTDEFRYYSRVIKNRIRRYKKETNLTYFEILTLLSFLYFFHKKPDYCLYETGIGGAFDATNIIESQFQIITSIEYEHTEILGNTLEKIFLQKLGIGKSKSSLLILDIPQTLLPLVLAYREKKENRVFLYKRDFHIVQNKNNLKFTGLFNTLNLKLSENLNRKLPIFIGGALFCLEYVTGNKLQENIVQDVLRKLNPQYRIEIISKKPLIIVDVAHTKQSVRNLVESLKARFPDIKFYTIFSAMKNKDVLGMLYYLRQITESFIFCSNLSKNSYAPEELVNLYYTYLSNNCNHFPTIEESVRYIYKNNLFPLLVCGSFYNISHLFQVLKNK